MNTPAKTSDVLKYVYDRIHNGWDDYICLAIESYALRDLPAMKRAKRLIHSRMQMGRFRRWVHRNTDYTDPYDPYNKCETSLDWWLVWQGYVKVDAMPTQAQMRAYRVAWLDELIKECAAKGD